METLEWIKRPLREWNGDVSLAKGGAEKQGATANMKTGDELENTLFGESQSEQADLLPFLTGEITNPGGLGAPALNAMTTAAGQTTSGSLSDATNRAKLQAARTGNTAGTSAIIANSSRNAANAQSDAQLGIQEENAKTKLQQQQEGAKGLGALGSADLSAALGSLGLSNEAINAWSGANKSAGGIGSDIMGLLGSASQGAFAGAGL